jgi:class 3 adenylate cyclase
LTDPQIISEEELYTDRSLTIVLLDLVNSTGFVSRFGAQRAARWFQYHDRLTRSLLYRFRGREIDRSDGFLFTFDRAVDALNFALYYQQTVPPKVKIKARVGVHYGAVVEVQQRELLVLAGAKPIEVEGITKNIAARTMSLAQPDQVLLTRDAFYQVRNRASSETPKGTRFALVGLYRFQGVRDAQVIYAVGSTIESLQPPPSSDKAKRLGGPRKIRSRLRHKRLREWLELIIILLSVAAFGYILWVMYPYLKYRVLEWWRSKPDE